MGVEKLVSPISGVEPDEGTLLRGGVVILTGGVFILTGGVVILMGGVVILTGGVAWTKFWREDREAEGEHRELLLDNASWDRSEEGRRGVPPRE